MSIGNKKGKDDPISKRKLDVHTSDDARRVKSRIKLNQPPRIPVRSTVASRSTENAKRASIASSVDSSTSTSSSIISHNTTVRDQQQRTQSPGVAPSRNLKRFKTDVSAKVTTKSLPKAIPSWDAKGNLNKLQHQLNDQDVEISEIEKLQNDLQSTVESKESLLQEARQKVVELENTLKMNQDRYDDEMNRAKQRFTLMNKSLMDENTRIKSKLSSFETELEDYQQTYTTTMRSIDTETAQNKQLMQTKQTLESEFEEIDGFLNDKRKKKEEFNVSLEHYKNECKRLATLKEEKRRTMLMIERQLLEDEKRRRRYHDKLQEMKGNIRVFCRVRPALDTKKNLASIKYFGEDNESIEFIEKASSTLGNVITKTHSFTFDRVFSPECTQKECYEEIEQLVQSSLDGFHVSIFAYGQTGSGKTYTMQGPSLSNEETTGMIPRAVRQIYDVAQKLNQFGWKYTMEGQFLEIYNETIHDLLGDASNYGKIKHEIHHDNESGKTSVTNITRVHLDSPTKLRMMLKKATQNRATGATNINERSSRSHSVFTLRLNGSNENTGETTEGVLNLIDLAGSERLAVSGSVGDRLRETQAINKSLSCLGDVIQALVNKKNDTGFVPYRNSKLTYLLQNSLGGNCKTLMFVNVSPLAEHFGESLCSLRFAQKVNNCKIPTAKKMVKN